MLGTDNVAVVVGSYGILAVCYVTNHRQMAQVFRVSHGILPMIVITALRDHVKVFSVIYTRICV